MLILLIGPKGSGKSHIGRTLEARRGVHFFRVEPLWLSYHEKCAAVGRAPSIADGLARIHPAVTEALGEYEHVSIETTGASAEILEDLIGLGSRFPLLLVKVKAPLALCLERIASRDQTHQIPMEFAAIERVYELSTAVDLPFDVVLDNVGLTYDQILQPFASFGLRDP